MCACGSICYFIHFGRYNFLPCCQYYSLEISRSHWNLYGTLRMPFIVSTLSLFVSFIHWFCISDKTLSTFVLWDGRLNKNRAFLNSIKCSLSLHSFSYTFFKFLNFFIILVIFRLLTRSKHFTSSTYIRLSIKHLTWRLHINPIWSFKVIHFKHENCFIHFSTYFLHLSQRLFTSAQNLILFFLSVRFF